MTVGSRRVLAVPFAASVALASVATPVAAQSFRGPTNSSPISLSRDGRHVWVVNPKANTVSVIATRGNRLIRSFRVGEDPRSVGLDPSGRYAYVANAADGSVTVLRITRSTARDVRARPDRRFGRRGRVVTGAEPWDLVVTPNGRRVFVANSAQDTITVIDVARRRIAGHLNLATSRCNQGADERLFQPRGMAVSRNSRRLLVTSFLAYVRPGGRQGDDTGKEGVVCRLSVNTRARRGTGLRVQQRITVAPQTTGFAIDRTGDAQPDATAAFPNQMQSVVIRGNQAYLPNIAASPDGPLRFNVDTQAFVSVLDGARSGSTRDAGAGKFLNLHLGAREPEQGKKKLFFANVWAIGFTRQSGRATAYVVSAGSDLLVKLNVAADGKLSFTVDDNTTRYIDLNDPATAATQGANAGKNPQGIAINRTGTRAYVVNVVSSNVSVVDLRRDRVIRVVRTAPLPPPGSQAEVNRVGAEVFFSSRGHFNGPPGTTVSLSERLSSEGWQSCSSCHFEGWTDGVIWEFAAGPRKSVPLNASFAPNNPNDQRILNYSAIFDEVEDFELNIRGVSGPGNLQTPVDCSAPPPNRSANDPAHGLMIGDNGNANLAPCVINAFAKANADRAQLTITLPGSTTAVPALTALREWARRAIRTPERPLANRPNGPSRRILAAGRTLFAAAGCAACHGGPKWTISTKDFASPPPAPELFTETNPAPLFGRPVGAQYLARFLRDVGSYRAGSPDINYTDGVGANEKAAPAVVNGAAQLPPPDALGIDFNGDGRGNGFNVPSLLGINLLPPYTHNGNCETVRCVIEDIRHRTANGTQPDRLADARARETLAAYVRSIDAQTPVVTP